MVWCVAAPAALLPPPSLLPQLLTGAACRMCSYPAHADVNGAVAAAYVHVVAVTAPCNIPRVPPTGINDKRVIARGGQGSISACTWNGAVVAVKTVDAVHAQTLMKEMTALKSLLHPNIVQVGPGRVCGRPAIVPYVGVRGWGRCGWGGSRVPCVLTCGRPSPAPLCPADPYPPAQVFGMCMSPPAIIMEYVTHGSLARWIRQRAGLFDDVTNGHRDSIALGIAFGMVRTGGGVCACLVHAGERGGGWFHGSSLVTVDQGSLLLPSALQSVAVPRRCP
jgi:hypothetical protein